MRAAASRPELHRCVVSDTLRLSRGDTHEIVRGHCMQARRSRAFRPVLPALLASPPIRSVDPVGIHRTLTVRKKVGGYRPVWTPVYCGVESGTCANAFLSLRRTHRYVVRHVCVSLKPLTLSGCPPLMQDTCTIHVGYEDQVCILAQPFRYVADMRDTCLRGAGYVREQDV